MSLGIQAGWQYKALQEHWHMTRLSVIQAKKSGQGLQGAINARTVAQFYLVQLSKPSDVVASILR